MPFPLTVPQPVSWEIDSPTRVVDEHDFAQRHRLADAARAGKWPTVLDLLSAHAGLVNSPRPGGTSGFTPLHQAACANAAVWAVQALIAFGALKAADMLWADVLYGDHLGDAVRWALAVAVVRWVGVGALDPPRVVQGYRRP